MKLLDLFSGIGGFSLGLEAVGFKTVAFCEINPYCRAVLKKHWPGVPIFEDIKTLKGADVGVVDAICGGFPCQDISVAGQGVGLKGERSGLWQEYRRLIDECRPKVAIIENVSVLRSRGLDQMLGEINALGYDAEWHCIPASAVGAPHRRDRIWIVAYPHGVERRSGAGGHYGAQAGDGGEALADADGQPVSTNRESGDVVIPQGRGEEKSEEWQRHGDATYNRGATLADADGSRPQGRLREILRECADQRTAGARGPYGWDEHEWFAQSGMGRVAHGVPSRVDRLRALGNAVVPQVAEVVGRIAMEHCR